jgi:hypothetical protein
MILIYGICFFLSTHTHIKQSLDVIVRRRDQQRYEQEKRDLFGNRSGDGEHDVNIDLEMAEGITLHNLTELSPRTCHDLTRTCTPNPRKFIRSI